VTNKTVTIKAETVRSMQHQRDDEDAAAVLTIVTALAASAAPTTDATTAVAAPSVWGDPAHRLGVAAPSATGWWASGMPPWSPTR